MPQQTDAIVIGAGVMGAATAARLARDRRVVLFEQFQIGHRRGSSHGRSRIFRFSYPDAAFVEMAMESLGLWREIERDSGKSLIYKTGGLDRGDHVIDNATALETCGAPYEMMDGAAANRRFATVSLPPDEPVLYQPDGGIALADEAVHAFIGAAVAAGADVRTNEAVIGLDSSADAATVSTDTGEWWAPVVVVTAGGWARRLLAPVGIELPVRETRETVSYFEFGHEMFPTLVEWGPPAIYALPSPGDGIKVGEHIAGPPTDPDEDGTVNEESVALLARWIAARFPKADPRPRFAETCIYTNTDDERFILERHGPIVVGSACSGHGFKFAPLIGKKLADLCD